MAIVVAAAVLPSIAASFVASAMRDAVRPEFSESAQIESSASLGWSSPLAATIDVRDGSEIQATLAISTPRGLLGWIGPVLGGSIGEVPVSFSLTAQLEGEKGRELLDRLRGADERSAAAGAAADSSVGATSRPVGETAGLPEGLSIAASGSIDLGIVDAERGLDLAIRSDRLELALLADRSLEAVVELRIGRVGDGRDLDGRLDLEVALSNALAADGSISWAKALGAISIEARELDFDWDGRDVSISSLRASASSDEASGLSLAARAEGSIDGELGTAEADLAWTAPFAEDGSLRRDLAGLGGTTRLSGFPSAVVAAMVPTPFGELFADLGSSFRAEIAVPKEQDAALVATLEMEHLRGEASARLDRTTGEIVEGRAEFSGAPSRRKVLSALGAEGSDEGSGWSRLPLAISIEGLELLGGQDLRIAGAKATLEPAGSLLSDLLPRAAIADDRPLTLTLAGAAMEARRGASGARGPRPRRVRRRRLARPRGGSAERRGVRRSARVVRRTARQGALHSRPRRDRRRIAPLRGALRWPVDRKRLDSGLGSAAARQPLDRADRGGGIRAVDARESLARLGCPGFRTPLAATRHAGRRRSPRGRGAGLGAGPRVERAGLARLAAARDRRDGDRPVDAFRGDRGDAGGSRGAWSLLGPTPISIGVEPIIVSAAVASRVEDSRCRQ